MNQVDLYTTVLHGWLLTPVGSKLSTDLKSYLESLQNKTDAEDEWNNYLNILDGYLSSKGETLWNESWFRAVVSVSIGVHLSEINDILDQEGFKGIRRIMHAKYNT